MLDTEEKNRPNCEQILVEKTFFTIKRDQLMESSTDSILKKYKFFVTFIEKKAILSNKIEIQT
jgi:hypothetical protein